MKARVARFGVAMEEPLLAELDQLVERRGTTRSKLLSDLVRAELMNARMESNVPAVAALTIVYDHHVRELMDKLTEMQHDLGDTVRASMHVHLEHDQCMEVIVMRGPSQQLQSACEKILGTRGVHQGGVELVTDQQLAPAAVRHDHHHTKATPGRK